LHSRKSLLTVEILCVIGIVLLIDSALKTLFIVSFAPGSYYLGLQGAFLPFENLEGIVGMVLAINPLIVLVFTRA
jgi:uncharacterized membrane protein